jgi:hypothetical protein
MREALPKKLFVNVSHSNLLAVHKESPVSAKDLINKVAGLELFTSKFSSSATWCDALPFTWWGIALINS